MAVRNTDEDGKRVSKDYLSSTISLSTLEVVLDDRFLNNSVDRYSNDQSRQSSAGAIRNGRSTDRRKRQICDPKSHRLIEKHRRDRINGSLVKLLQLIPHVPPEPQRRIEKTEIIEMAVKHVRYLMAILDQKSTTTDTTIDSYGIGYRDSLADIFEILQDYSDMHEFVRELKQYLKEKNLDLDALTSLIMPDKKRVKYANKSTQSSCKKQMEEDRQNKVQSGNIERESTTQQSHSNVQVPIFVLHPSGTHYIPMSIDSSLVSHAFKKTSNSSHSSSITEQAQCHPVFIPGNINPINTFSDSCALNIQNINVITT